MCFKITSDEYYERATCLLELYRKTPYKNLLFYAAWEFRCCIERILFEYLYLLKINDWSKSFEKLYRAKDLRKTILRIEPEFIKKLEFINVYLKALWLPNRVFILDLSEISTMYGRLNSYLHAPKEPSVTVERPDWWEQIIELLYKTKDILCDILSGTLAQIELSDQGWELYNKWLADEVSPEEAIQRIRRELRKNQDSKNGEIR